jgi:sugar phosphate isomerase/epimerase
MYAQRLPGWGIAPFVRLGREMGFERFELSPIHSPTGLAEPGWQGSHISSVHDPCPRTQADASVHLASPDEQRRLAAVEALRASMTTAARLGARAVVVHLGKIEDDALSAAQFELRARYEAGLTTGNRYEAARRRVADCRAAGSTRHLDAARRSLDQALEMAARLDVRLGLETLSWPDGLPDVDEMELLLNAYGGSPLGAWLDTGHVGALANLGVATFERWWQAVGQRWVGVHLHDVRGLRDHLVPGLGDLDFKQIARHLPDDCLRTLEVDWYFTPDEIGIGLQHLRAARLVD